MKITRFIAFEMAVLGMEEVSHLPRELLLADADYLSEVRLLAMEIEEKAISKPYGISLFSRAIAGQDLSPETSHIYA